MQVAELVTKFSFAGNLKPLDNFNAGLSSAVGSITKVAGVLSVAGVALNGFLASTLASTDAQLQLSKEIGVSVEEMQTLGYVASVNGSNAEAMTNSLEGLAKKIGEASIQGSADFSRLGISVQDSFGNIKKSSTVLFEIRDRFKQLGLSVEQQKAYLDKFGIDKSLLQTMNLTGKEMDSLVYKARQLGVVTQDQAQQVADFNDSLTTTKFGLSAIQKQVAIAFAPTMKDLANNFTDLLVANKDAVQEGLKKFFELVNLSLGSLFRMGKFIYEIIDGTIGFQNALMLAGGAMLYLNRAMYLNPIGLIIGLVVGLLLVMEDLWTGLKGGRSVVADFFQEWFGIDILPIIQGMIDNVKLFGNIVKTVFGGVVDIVKTMFGGIASTFKLLTGQISFGEWVEEQKQVFFKLVDIVKGVFDKIYEYIKPVFESLEKLVNFKLPSWGDVGKGASNVLGDMANSTGQFFSNLNPFGSSSSSSVSNTNNNNINIEVKTDNPQLAGQIVSTELNSQLKTANSNFNKGGM